ncbi:MAG: hypothetical protein ACM3SX_21645 [Deltaproteobacteria bacterium]
MNVKLSIVVAGLLLALSTATQSQTPAPTPKRDLGAEAMGGMSSSRSAMTPEQQKAMQAEKTAGKQPPAPKAPAKVTAVQPGLLEVTGGRVSDAVAAGIQKITAKASTDKRAIQIYSPWGHMYSAWPQGVKPVDFTIETMKGGGAARISAPGFTEANKDDYKAAVDAVVTMAIDKASAQKAAKTRM